MYCKNCAFKLDNDAKFCSRCGLDLTNLTLNNKNISDDKVIFSLKPKFD